MEQEDRIDIYTIPPNFAEEGTLLSGRIKTRNAVETGVILLILVPVLLSLNTTVRVKMYIGMIVLVPVNTTGWCRILRKSWPQPGAGIWA